MSTSTIRERLEEIRRQALEALSQSLEPAQVESVRVRVLGRNGELTELIRSLRSLPEHERPVVGQLANQLKRELEERIEALARELRRRRIEQSLAQPALDVTLPGMEFGRGRIHPLTQITGQILEIWTAMGFEVALTPDIEDDFHNFGALNFPPDHPAREMQDTFFLEGGRLLRTHTSNGQIRVMERRRPPLAVVCPGTCYRRDELSVRYSPMFSQLEGFMVDDFGKVTMAHLKGTLTEFLRAFFGPEADVRFRASFFPFTEPSAETDVRCIFCKGAGCRVCKQSGWIEILGCGMIHPNVLRAVGYDPQKHAGFAFGMGLERLALIRLGVEDMRLFFENDLRFLAQF